MNIETTFAPLLDTLVKSAALILIGAVLIAALRRSSAANRHAVSVTIFAALLLLPFTRLVPARWSFPLEKPAAPALSLRLPVIETASVSTGSAPAPIVEKVAQPAPRTPLVIPWKKLAVAVWLAGAALLLVRRALIGLRLRSIVRRSFPIEDERLAAKVHALVEAGGVRAEVRESEHCRVPLASGMVRPVVLLPAGAADWSDAFISSALRHELGHVRRRDCVTRLLADVLCAIYWVNPLVWFAARQMRLAQEQACDDLVLNAGAPADEYAGQLVEVVRSLQGDRFTSRHALAMAQPSTLETRVLAIVDGSRDRSSRSVRGTFASFALVATMLALCTAAQLRGADEKKPAPAAAANAPQVEIEAKFLEITGEDPALADFLKAPEPKAGADVARVLSAENADIVVKALNARKGVDLLYSPRLITVSKHQAKIKIGREFRHATAWEKDSKSGEWKPTVFDTKNLGVTFDVTPEANADGTIDLTMTPEVVEFAGFKDLDGDATKIFGKPDTGKPLSERLTEGPAGIGIPEGHRAQALFNTRKVSTKVNVSLGMTVVLDGMQQGGAAAGGKQPQRRLVVLVTARIAKPGGIPVEKPAVPGAAPAKPAGKLNVPRLGQTRNEVIVGFGEPRESVMLASGTESMRFETESSRFIAEISLKSDSVIQIYVWRRTRYTEEQIAGLLSDNAEGNAWRPIQGSIEAGFRFDRSDGGIARGGPQQEGHMVSILSGSERKPKDAKPAENGILPKQAVPAASPGEAPGKSAGKTGAVTDPKPLQILSDKMSFDKKTGTLSASGSVRIETAQAVIAAAAVEITPKNTAAAASAENANAGAAKPDTRWILPSVEFRDATVREIVEFLATKSRTQDPAGVGANIILKDPEKIGAAKVTLSLKNIPLAEVLRYVAALANCEVVQEPFAFVVRPAQAVKVPAPNPPAAPAPAEPKGAALKKAGTLILPKLDIREATVAETLDFLREKSKDLDPDKTGLNLVLVPGPAADARITLTLANTPLAEILRYVAALGGYEVFADENVITLRPPAK